MHLEKVLVGWIELWRSQGFWRRTGSASIMMLIKIDSDSTLQLLPNYKGSPPYKEPL